MPRRDKTMTVDEFIPWAMAHPRGRWELIDGEPRRMSPERARHRKVKGAIFLALRLAVERAGVACVVEPDGATVRIDEHRSYEPDALVYEGPELPEDSIEVPNPLIVVEVLSPGSETLDTCAKFRGYFSLPTLAHYLIVDPDERTIVHQARAPDGRIVSTAVTEGLLALDPRALELAVSDMLPD